MFDETIEAMTAALAGESVDPDGGFFPAVGHSMLPRPVQRPRPADLGGRQQHGGHAPGRAPGRRLAALPPARGHGGHHGQPSAHHHSTTSRRASSRSAGCGPRPASTGPSTWRSRPSAVPIPRRDPDGSAFREQVQTYADAGVTWLTLGCRGRSLAGLPGRAGLAGRVHRGPLPPGVSGAGALYGGGVPAAWAHREAGGPPGRRAACPSTPVPPATRPFDRDHEERTCDRPD